MKVSCPNFIYLITITILTLSGITPAQRPIYDEWGNATGIVNMNPNPDGEIWAVGPRRPLTEEDWEIINNIPEVKMSEKTRKRQLPEEFILTEHSSFPPLFSQGSTNSCSQSSVLGYMYTFERNVLYDLDGTNEMDRAAPGFSWNFLNDAQNYGSWQYDGIYIAQKIAPPTVKDFNESLFGNSSYTYWASGYEKFHNANIAFFDELQEIDVSDMNGIEKLKNWFYDFGDGSTIGGPVTFSGNTNWDTQTINGGPHNGDLLATYQEAGTAHAMTYAGYSELIEYDLNNDGRITINEDVNNDGRIDINDRERGAILLLNTWGDYWMNGNKLWLTYAAVANGTWNANVWCAKVKKHEPKLEYRVTLSHDRRSNIKITAGFANGGNAVYPNSTKSFSKAYNFCGGSLPLGGEGENSEIEIGLDVSEYFEMLASDEASTFFLTVESNGGYGSIVSFELLDYSIGNDPVIYSSDDANVAIKGETTVSVVRQQSVSHFSSPIKKNDISFKSNSRMLEFKIRDNNINKATINIRNVSGRLVHSITHNNLNEGVYSSLVPGNLTSGVYLISLALNNKQQVTIKSVIK